MKKTIYLIHHSHTDIGYTHPQEIIKLYHRDFIDQAIDIILNDENSEFCWTCENFWQIENYFKSANLEQANLLIKLMRAGRIDYSLNYLNMTELIDMDIYEQKLMEAVNFSMKNNLNFNTALSADINGYSKLYIEKLAKCGIRNNFSCVHTHHGAHAFGKKPYIFNWETKYGNVKTVLAPHYHLGNELFLMPNAGTTYLLDDTNYGTDANNEQFVLTRKRILKYLADVEKNEEYNYDFMPIMISGVISDNGMPNAEICDLITRWNQKYNDVELKLTTLNQFFKSIECLTEELPIHCGDMNDWWADGVGSTPKTTKLFKSAQRKYTLLQQLNSQYQNSAVIENLIMYAEHTWGHSASISNPYNYLVDEIMLKKQNYAVTAHALVNEDIETFLLGRDKVTILPNREKRFRVVNILEHDIKTTATITIEHWELIDRISISNTQYLISVIDENKNKYLSQVRPSDRGHEIEFEIALKSKESMILQVVAIQNTNLDLKHEVCDKVNDYQNKRFNNHVTNIYSTEHYKLSIDINNNHIQLFDKDSHQLVSDSYQFLKLISTTTIASDQCQSRRLMGRNRISGMSQTNQVTSINFEYLEIGPVYTVVRIHQNLCIMEEAYLDIKLYNNIKRINFEVNYLKQVSKNIENIYFNFNFAPSIAKSLVLSKSGDEFDPANDLLPEANNQFFMCGEMVRTTNYTVLSPDCALVTFNNGQYKSIDLEEKVDKSKLNFWLANNFWETNFYNDLSGYHSFRFELLESALSCREPISFENPLVYPTKN